MKVPFNAPYYSGNEAEYIKQAFKNKQLSGDGPFTKRASTLLEELFTSPRVLLTHSCTAALEICALLLEVKPGDEIIMPSYTFVSTANAFALRGAIPVFVDIDAKTQNIDISSIEKCITQKTKLIVVVHYAGISCDMDKLMNIARSFNIPVVEDAAQSIYSRYKNQPLGSFGDLATVSFHETKNISCGEGGALLINNKAFIRRAEIVREKGTNRSQFYRGETDKYTWVDIGSSYLPGEVTAAYLYAQLQFGIQITEARLKKWNAYSENLKQLEASFGIQCMSVPSYSRHNAHMFYLICNTAQERTDFIDYMKSKSIGCVFHYVPLHLSPAGIKYGKQLGTMENTKRAGDCLVRLPLYPGVDNDFVIDSTIKFFST